MYDQTELTSVVAELRMQIVALAGINEATQRELTVLAHQLGFNLQKIDTFRSASV